MNPDIGLIIFDCDGTLCDTEHANNLATIELLHEQGLQQFDMEYALAHFVGKRFSEILRDIAAQTGHVFPPDMSAQYIQRARDLLPAHQKKIEGAEEFVRQAQSNMKICVASNGQRENVIYSLELAGLLPYFAPQHIFTGLDVKTPKPAPDLFLLAAKTLGTPPGKSLVIEDSVVGVTAGKAAEMLTFGFTGAHPDQDTYARVLHTAGADEIHPSFIHMATRLFG